MPLSEVAFAMMGNLGRIAAAELVGQDQPKHGNYLGQHTEQVLADVLGPNSTQIGDLVDCGLAAPAGDLSES